MSSERDGWRHLYLIDARTGAVKNAITKGQYVVRGIDRIDEEKRQIWFQRQRQERRTRTRTSSTYYRVNFDGTGLVALTEGNGSHYGPVFARPPVPDRHLQPGGHGAGPRAEASRRRQAGLQARGGGHHVPLKASGWQPPEVFVAKGRDGKTDIWGIICRPKEFDPHRKYPVIEQIYAGPQGSFVPKTFSPRRRFSSLTDLGFIVVQIDGMGTANRSKAFHDVCWHNLKDAGFPDRILWHQAVARKVPVLRPQPRGDLRHVGRRPERDRRRAVPSRVLQGGGLGLRLPRQPDGQGLMERAVDGLSRSGRGTRESSNIDNAHRLQGKLLLIVGEMDTNVPPESTMRLVDALIKAGKDFELSSFRTPTTAWAAPTASGGCAISSCATCWAASRPTITRTRLAMTAQPATAAAAVDKKPVSPTPMRLEPVTTSLRPGGPQRRPQRASRRDRAVHGRPRTACSDRSRRRPRRSATSGCASSPASGSTSLASSISTA